jgi:hypothetical protein
MGVESIANPLLARHAAEQRRKESIRVVKGVPTSGHASILPPQRKTPSENERQPR